MVLFFLFRRPRGPLDCLPLVSHLLPGSQLPPLVLLVVQTAFQPPPAGEEPGRFVSQAATVAHGYPFGNEPEQSLIEIELEV